MGKVRRLCLWLTIALSASLAAAAEPAKLRVTLQVPATNPFIGLSVVQFKDEVDKATDKALLVEIFDNGQLYIDDQVVGAVQSGAIEMGVAGFNQISRRLPAVDIMEQPFLFNFEALARTATSPDSDLRKLIDKAILETIGVRVLWWQTIGPQVFFARGENLTDPESLSNKRIRVFSQTMASFTQHCGGAPLVLSITKIHDALKDGTIDIAMSSVVAAETRQLWKVADTITRTDHALIEFLVIINEKTWESLTEGQRTIVVQAAKTAERDVRAKASRLEAEAYDFARSKGMKVYELTPDQVADWRACSAGVLDTYMSSGGELIWQLMRAYGKLRTDPCCSTGPAGAFNRR